MKPCVSTNLKETEWEGVDLINLAKGRSKWCALVNSIMKDLYDP
jgi:hypothetical protein